ncbi:uncharacterized protein [Mobula birostris]|uniref:uncharacterized protein n=1 Tax=Mobula birostris TaxID=1983395 RepID=UPI003B27EED4
MAVIYRPPNSCRDVDYKLQPEIEKACQKGNVMIIVGDFNMRVDWKNQVDTGSQEREFVECLRDGFLEQLVVEPTKGFAVLDWVLCNEPEVIGEIEVKEPLGGSDHNMIEFTVKLEKEKPKSDVSVFQWSKGNYSGMREELAKVDWKETLAGRTAEQQWLEFMREMRKVQDRYIPKKKKFSSGKRMQPWLTREVKAKVKAKERAYKEAKISGKTEDWEVFKTLRKKTKKVIKREKINYERKLANNIKEDTKSFFKYIKSKRQVRVDIGPIENDTGEIVMGDEEIAEELNKYFASVFTEEDSRIPDTQGWQGREVCAVTITTEKVLRKLNRLKVDNSPGPDGMHPRVLKEVAVEIAEALAMIFQKSIDSGMVPEDWKIANVTPLFKKGARKQKGNYTPVSLTSRKQKGNYTPVSLMSVVGKLLESIVKDEVTEYLEAYDKIGRIQHGFLKGKSCLTNLLQFFKEIASRLDKGDAVDVLYLDFQKVFDKVPHMRLLNKIRAHGITGKLHTWIERWLIGRKQRVGIKVSYSGWLPATSGVPQGSVLGPLFFTLYINDLDYGIDGFVAKFADDTKIGGGAGSAEETESLQRDLDRLEEWAEKWQMKYNVGKCMVMHFGRKNKRADYYLNGERIQSSEMQRDLGVLVQDSLKVNLQVESVVKKANVMLAFISRGIEYRNRDVMLRLYKVLVRPHLEYCGQFWSPYLRKDVLTLERVQRRFTRMIPGMRGLRYEEHLSALGLYSLEFRRMRGDLIETFRMLKGMDRVDVAKLFPMMGESSTRGHDFRIEGRPFRTEMRKNFFSQRVVNLWNLLPRAAVEAKSLGVFKAEICRYLSSQGIKGYGEKAGQWG